ncbi:unnamed protein product [Phytophthora fragariaefolia]|uniref:Unnamed protein product n=1 Tax=Phytophthora fragariaefolia TaxID=1490495 RepID=A0A9W6YPZ1_9STRA|nr:unnamed protein product [Phytophthora fragariaefolia]
MGFTYAPVIHDSELYNPLFYSYLGSDGSVTYAYAQTLFLSRNNYRLSYLSGSTLGIASEGLALVPGSGGNISGIGALGCSSLMVGGSSVVAPPSYVIGIIEGAAAASKALVLNSTLDVSGINALSATSLSGTLQTASQPNIISLGTLTPITTSGALAMSGVSISSSEISVLDGVSPGTAAPSKALVLNSSSNISGIASLSATSLTVTTISASGTINLSGIVNCNNSAYAASPLSGSLVVSGGKGIQKNIAIGGIASSSSQWALLGIQYQSRATTYTDTSTAGCSTVASSVISSYAQPAIASTNSITISRAATVYIENSVASSTNTTITNAYRLWIANGKVLLGDTSVSSSTTTGALVVSGGLGVGGQLSASTIAGTIQTAAQPNITSIGTLSSLTVSGGLSASTLTGTLQTASQPNITSVGALTSLTVAGGLSASTLAGTLQTAAQPNITLIGTLTARTVSGSIDGTLSTAAQPNITSVGTLTSLSVSGSISGTLSSAAQPNITSVDTLSSLSVSGSLTGTLSTAAQPNITSVGTLSSLSVSGVSSITNTTYATSPSNGALVVSGGIGIGKNLYIGSSQTITSWATTGPQIATITATYTNSSTASGGTAATAVMNSFAQCTLAATNTGVITTRAATVYISGAPIAGSNMSITNPYAMLVASGRVLLDGAVSATSLTSGTLQVSGGMSVGENLYCSYMNTSTGICIHETAAKQTSWLTTTGSLTNWLDGSYSILQDWYGGNVTPIRAVLEVNNGSSATSTNAGFFGSSTDNDLKLGTNNATRMTILGGANAGRVGIGSTSPAHGLHNTLTVSTTLDAAGTGVAYFLKSGGLMSTLGPLSAIPVGIGTLGAILATCGCYTTSDARLNKDWTELNDDVCDAMLKVEPLLFRYKSDDDTIPLQIGYKAQALLRANLPHCINFTPNA